MNLDASRVGRELTPHYLLKMLETTRRRDRSWSTGRRQRRSMTVLGGTEAAIGRLGAGEIV